MPKSLPTAAGTLHFISAAVFEDLSDNLHLPSMFNLKATQERPAGERGGSSGKCRFQAREGAAPHPAPQCPCPPAEQNRLLATPGARSQGKPRQPKHKAGTQSTTRGGVPERTPSLPSDEAGLRPPKVSPPQGGETPFHPKTLPYTSVSMKACDRTSLETQLTV